jgi:hypothetical protein
MQDLQAQFAFRHAFNKELKDSDTFVAAERLAFLDRPRSVRAGSYGTPAHSTKFRKWSPPSAESARR